ncbi:MAG: biotin/lipoyl-containing protein [Thermosulfidibacteraceae bacterium]|jgi:biotin carboxyl carrier protein
MPYIVTYEDKEFRVSLKGVAQNLYEVKIEELDGEGNTVSEKTYTVDIVTKDFENFSVICNGNSYEVDVEDKGENNFEVFVNGEHFAFNLMDEFRKKMEEILHGGKERVASGEVRTSMPGKVTRVFVKEGDKVETDTPLLTIEAMKMENEFRAPKSGIVKTVKVKVGDVVNAGALLVVIE